MILSKKFRIFCLISAVMIAYILFFFVIRDKEAFDIDCKFSDEIREEVKAIIAVGGKDEGLISSKEDYIDILDRSGYISDAFVYHNGYEIFLTYTAWGLKNPIVLIRHIKQTDIFGRRIANYLYIFPSNANPEEEERFLELMSGDFGADADEVCNGIFLRRSISIK